MSNQVLKEHPQPFSRGISLKRVFFHLKIHLFTTDPLRFSKLVYLNLHVSLEDPQIVLKDFEHENAPDSCITNCQGLYG